MRYKFFNRNVSNILLTILVIFPKIDLIPIPGYWQGIRIENIIILLFAFIFIFKTNLIINFRNQDFQYKNFYYFFLYLFFSNIVGLLSNLDVKFLIVIRLVEYLFYLFLIDGLNIKKKFLINLLFGYLVLNTIIVFLQLNDLVGSFSSLGYMGPEHPTNSRALGLLGGSWELSIVTTLSYIFIFKNEKSKFIIFLVFCISAFLVIVSESKTQTITFSFAVAMLLIQSKRYVIFFMLILLSLLVFAYFDIIIFNKIKKLDLLYLYELTYGAFVLDTIPVREQLKDHYVNLSYWYRLNFWITLYNEFQTNISTILFGTGFTRVYVESFHIRILFSSGVIGLMFLVFLIRNIDPLYLIIFLIAGTTLDLFVSFKIFLMTLIIIKNNFNEKKNIN